MNQEQLELFLEVIQLGSFQKVAEKRYVSQRAVSRQIQRLERELNTQLFSREKNKITLAQAGKFFEQRCRTMLKMVNDTEHELHRFSYRGETQLSIGYFSPFDAIFIHDLMAALPQEINTFISEEGVEHLVSDVMLGSLDCAIILDNYGFNYDYSKMGLEAIPIHQDKMVMGISEHLGQQEKIDLGLIKKMPVAYYSNEDSVYLKHAFINSLQGVVKPLEVLRVDSYEQLQLLVGSGQALSFYPQKLVQRLQRPVERIDYLPLKTNVEQNCEFKLIYKRASKAPGLKLVRDYFREN